MTHTQTRPRSHRDVRHHSQIPLPAVGEVEQRLLDMLRLSSLAPRHLERRDPRPPQRLIRMREKTACRTVQMLSQGLSYRDDIIQVGQYRSNPYQHPRRLVSVLWQGTLSWDGSATSTPR